MAIPPRVGHGEAYEPPLHSLFWGGSFFYTPASSIPPQSTTIFSTPSSRTTFILSLKSHPATIAQLLSEVSREYRIPRFIPTTVTRPQKAHYRPLSENTRPNIPILP